MIRNQTEFDLYIRLELAGSLRCDKGWAGDEHKHIFWEILYIVAGECSIRIEDREWILTEGQAIMIKPLESHLFASRKENTVMAYVGYSCETHPNLWLEQHPDSSLILDKIPNHENLVSVMTKIVNTATLQGMEIDLVNGLIPIVQWMKLQSKAQNNPTGNHKNMLCMKTIKYIRSNMERFVSVEEIAASLYVTPHYLGQIFSTHMGQTILKYQQSLKMERAVTMIRSRNMSLTDISDQLGFSSPQYFSKCFKTYYGFSPNHMKLGKG